MNQGEIKACLFNLVIFAQDAERVAYLRSLAHSVIAKFPCKIIVVQGDPQNSDTLRVGSSNKSNGQIICDEMIIDAGAAKLKIVPYLITPQLVADLPIYLLWGQDPTADQTILPFLEKYAAKLIFDSSCTSNLQHFSQAILRLMETSNAELMDLNWAKIAGWRDAIKTIFDTEELVKILREAQEITIQLSSSLSNESHNPRLQAIYLQAWLASRLNWKFTEQQSTLKGTTLVYDSGKHTVHVTEEEKTEQNGGSIFSLDIFSGEQSFCFAKKEKYSKISVHISNADSCKLPITLPFPDLQKSSVFMQEVFYQSANRHYRSMLQTISLIEWDA